MTNDRIFYLNCPTCGHQLQIPGTADLNACGNSFMVAICFDCRIHFGYDYSDIYVLPESVRNFDLVTPQ